MHADEPTPPFTVASQLEPPDHHVNFTETPTMAWPRFFHLNCTPAPLEGLTDELTTGGSTTGKKIGIFPRWPHVRALGARESNTGKE